MSSARPGVVASSPRRVARPALVALALFGCGAPEAGVRAEPSALVFTPAAPRLELSLVNRSDATVPLSKIRFDPRSPDWGAFLIEDREHPREIVPGGAVSLHLRIDREHFTRRGADYAGHSRLLFVAGTTTQIVELHYRPPAPATAVTVALVRSALLLGLVALTWALSRRRRGRAPLTWTTWLPAIVVFALLPLGPGLCPDALGQPLSSADVEQCAAGRGGVPLSLVAVGEGWLVYLVVLVLAGIGRLREGTALARRLAAGDLALALAFSGPLLAFGTLDPRLLVGEQSAGLFGAAAIPPSWGLLVQPIAAAVALAVIAGPPRPLQGRLAFAAAFTVCFLGGHTLPGLAPAGAAHGLVLAVGAGVFAAKTAAIVWLVRRLQASGSGSRARAAVILFERAALPLAIVSLLMTSAYTWLR